MKLEKYFFCFMMGVMSCYNGDQRYFDSAVL